MAEFQDEHLEEEDDVPPPPPADAAAAAPSPSPATDKHDGKIVTKQHASGNGKDDCSDLTDNNPDADDSTPKTFPQKVSSCSPSRFGLATRISTAWSCDGPRLVARQFAVDSSTESALHHRLAGLQTTVALDSPVSFCSISTSTTTPFVNWMYSYFGALFSAHGDLEQRRLHQHHLVATLRQWVFDSQEKGKYDVVARGELRLWVRLIFASTQ